MRIYITLDEIPRPGQTIPPGTKATTEPREALREAQSQGKAYILLFAEPPTKPILRSGRTTRPLDPCRPLRFYRTEQAAVIPYPGKSGRHREKLRTV